MFATSQPIFGSKMIKIPDDILKVLNDEQVDALRKANETEDAEVYKSSDELKILFGFGSVIETESGGVYTDSQSDIIESEELIKATTEYMQGERESRLMHGSEMAGTTIHSFPLTKEIAKKLGIQTENYGWLVGVQMNDTAWELVKSSKMRAFSIGARAVRTPVV